MRHVHESIDVGGMTVEIVQDLHPDSPLWECDPEDRGVLMLCWHRKYNFGDVHAKYNRVGHPRSYSDWNQVEREIKRLYRPLVILPLAVHDHGNVHMYVGRGGDWDSGQVGFAFDFGKSDEHAELRESVGTRINEYTETLRHAFRETQPEDEDEEDFQNRLHAAVDEFVENIGNEFPELVEARKDVMKRIYGWVEDYDHYLNGNVWGFEVKSPEGDVLESCWGFIGDPDESGVIQEGRATAESLLADREREAARCDAVMHL